MKFIKCPECGSIHAVISESAEGACKTSSKELKANTTDGPREKHVPVVSLDGDVLTVKIGEVPHPMLPEHHIAWVAVETQNGFFVKHLKEGKPEITFKVCPTCDKVVAVYEYCNLHGLWKKEM